MKTHKQANLYIETHNMLEEIIESGYKIGNQVKKASKAELIHELVSKLHKKECK